MWCGESRGSPRVLDAEYCDLHALDGGDGREQVCRRLGDQTNDVQIIFNSVNYCFFVIVLLVHSPTRRMNLNIFFPNCQLCPRGNTSIQTWIF